MSTASAKLRAQRLAEFSHRHAVIVAVLGRAEMLIDSLGGLGDIIAGGDRCDQLACYAANTLQGSRSLLREMRALVEKPRRRDRAGRGT